MTQVGQCRLCLSSGVQLLDSHVIPKWAYNWIVQRTPNARNPVLVSPGKAYTSSKQRKTYLLCRPCENLIGASETYVSSRLRHGQSIRSFNESLVELAVCPSADRRLVGLGNWDRNRLVHFGASILWRWHVYPWAKEKLVLGSQYGEAFRQYVLGATTFPSNATVIIQCFEDSPGGKCNYEEMIYEPSKVAHPGYDVHHFFVCGIRYIFALGRHIPRDLTESCLVRGQPAGVAIMTPTSDLVDLVAPLVGPIIAKTGGVLGKRRT